MNIPVVLEYTKFENVLGNYLMFSLVFVIYV